MFAFQEQTLTGKSHSSTFFFFFPFNLKNVLSGERKNSYSSDIHNAPTLVTADSLLERFLGVQKKL